MEPFWNPAVEVRFDSLFFLLFAFADVDLSFRNRTQNQAVDRVYRLGQTMPVVTVRFVIQKSIEENMLKYVFASSHSPHPIVRR